MSVREWMAFYALAFSHVQLVIETGEWGCGRGRVGGKEENVQDCILAF